MADLPELNENKEKELDNLKLPAFIVARFTNGCTYTWLFVEFISVILKQIYLFCNDAMLMA